MRSLAFGLAALLPVLSAAAPAVAQQSDTEYYTAYFYRLDQDKDGGFTLVDLQRISAKEFRRTDEDGDGTLSLAEYLYGIPVERQDVLARFTGRFRASDTDGDGAVTPEEDAAFCQRLVAAADANHDGVVSLDEYLAVGGGER
jgi:hypothetical protein